ncbi:MAG TPA: hypothetical protein VKR22_09450 [Acidimicrobiales bacterium]|nr:hypothetical protein [Acidimicrobiales bacterium]
MPTGDAELKRPTTPSETVRRFYVNLLGGMEAEDPGVLVSGAIDVTSVPGTVVWGEWEELIPSVNHRFAVDDLLDAIGDFRRSAGPARVSIDSLREGEGGVEVVSSIAVPPSVPGTPWLVIQNRDLVTLTDHVRIARIERQPPTITGMIGEYDDEAVHRAIRSIGRGSRSSSRFLMAGPLPGPYDPDDDEEDDETQQQAAAPEHGQET